MPKKTLTPQQSKFLEEYPKDLNATQAAIRAGYSKKTANEQGSRLLKMLKQHVQAMQATPAQPVSMEPVSVSAPVSVAVSVPSPPALTDQSKSELNRFMTRLEQLAYVDVGRMFDQHNNAIDIPDLPADVRPAIAGFEILEEFEGRGAERKSIGFTKKFKLVDPLAAILALGKVKGFYAEKETKAPSPLESAAIDTLLAMKAAIEQRQLERAS